MPEPHQNSDQSYKRVSIPLLVSLTSSYPLFYDNSNGVVYFVFHSITVRTVWYILFSILWQFERCDIFCVSFYNCSNDVVYFVFHFMTIRTVWYILFSFDDSSSGAYIFLFVLWQFELCGIFCFSLDDSSNSVVSFVSHFIAVRTVVYFVFHFITVRTVWYICFSFYNCSNGVVYFVSHFMTVRTVWYILFFTL